MVNFKLGNVKDVIISMSCRGLKSFSLSHARDMLINTSFTLEEHDEISNIAAFEDPGV